MTSRRSLARRLLFPLVLGAFWALAAATPARAVFITFDPGDPIGGLAVGATLGNQYAAFGVTFSPNALTGSGGPTGDWATNTTMAIASSTGSDVGGLGTPSLVSGNLLRSFSGWLAEDGDPSFRATFSTAVTSFSADFAGIASPSSTRILAFNGTTLVATATATTTTGQQTLTVLGANITSVVITPGDFFDWVGVDNINFTPVVAVPEPSTLALCVIAGATGLAGARLRRKRATA